MGGCVIDNAVAGRPEDGGRIGGADVPKPFEVIGDPPILGVHGMGGGGGAKDDAAVDPAQGAGASMGGGRALVLHDVVDMGDGPAHGTCCAGGANPVPTGPTSAMVCILSVTDVIVVSTVLVVGMRRPRRVTGA